MTMPVLVDPCEKIGDEQVEFFATEGYLSLARLADLDEIEALRTVYDEIIAGPDGYRLHFESRRDDGSLEVIEQVLMPELQRPELVRSPWFAQSRRLACRLLGIAEDELQSGATHMIYKPANAGRDTPWHQDEAYWDAPRERAHAVSVWMPLDDVTVDSGCMQFLPRSQDRDVLTYRKPSPLDPLVLVDDVDLSAAVACPIPAGGATVHHCRVLHYTGPNTTGAPRRAISALFKAPPTERDEPLARPWLTAS
jgi:ectoine hydroxylase-related dioxygenase (phytanoyl-CoA dioxygenase family)